MRKRMKLLAQHGRGYVATIFPLLLLLVLAAYAHAGEIVPSMGVSKPVDSEGNAKMLGGLAVRGHLGPLFMSEIGVGYRSESRFGDQLKLRQWPVTASLYVSPPNSIVYAGAGVGWYNTTFDYEESTGIPDDTRQDFGVHLGGGFQVPFGEHMGVDLNGRYVMLQDQESHLIPEKFNPDFWQTSLGLAFKF